MICLGTVRLLSVDSSFVSTFKVILLAFEQKLSMQICMPSGINLHPSC